MVILSMYYSLISQLAMSFMFLIAVSGYYILAPLTGATDPLAAHGGTQIPEVAWKVFYLFLLSVSVFFVIKAVLKFKRGQPNFLIFVGHVILMFVGWISCLLIGSVNFPFVK